MENLKPFISPVQGNVMQVKVSATIWDYIK